MAALPQILDEARKQFIKYTAKKDPEAGEQVREPHIWINRDELEEEENPERWTFVIGREDSPDFGYHIEFDGLTCLEIWSARLRLVKEGRRAEGGERKRKTRV